MKTYISIATVSVAGLSFSSATNLLIENFEDSTLTYTISVAESSDGAEDYFGRVAPDGISIATAMSFSNIQGVGFFAAHDIDAEVGSSPQTLTFSGINILNFENLSFSGFFAEDDDASNQDWDASDFLLVEAQIDSGGFTTIFQIENDGTTFNAAPLIDTNFDGTGDGDEITDVFTQYSAAISGTGNTLDLRITIDLDSGDEDIAFDNISVDGDAVTIPEPSSALLGGLALLGLLRRRR